MTLWIFVHRVMNITSRARRTGTIRCSLSNLDSQPPARTGNRRVIVYIVINSTQILRVPVGSGVGLLSLQTFVVTAGLIASRNGSSVIPRPFL
jgi:hypothetical protein